MAWTDLSFPAGSLLTSTKMTQLDENIDALAAGASGAPRLAIDDVSSLAKVHASSGFEGPEVSSFGTVDAASGMQTGGVCSLDTVITQMGFDAQFIEQTSVGFAAGVEKVVLTTSIAAKGNKVTLHGWVWYATGAGDKILASIRVGSLGGTIVTSNWANDTPGAADAQVGAHAVVQPSSGPASYVFTLKPQNGSARLTNAYFEAVERGAR